MRLCGSALFCRPWSAWVTVAFVSTSLSGCGILDLCHNDCGPGWTHASFDCGCMQISKTPPIPTNQGSPFTIVRRYYCVEETDPSRDRGDCTVTRSGSSCAEALSNIDSYFSSVRDPCKRCDPNVLDNTRRYNNHFDDVQGGACQGFSSILPTSTGRAATRSATPPITRANFGLSVPAQFNHYMRLIAEEPHDNAPATCDAQCRSGSPFCLNINLDQLNSVGFRRLHQALLHRPNLITADNLRSMFGNQKDECMRGQTTFSGGEVFNAGSNICELEANIPDAGDVSLEIPYLIRGTWSVRDSFVSVSFGNPKTRGRLKFSDPGLQQDWGGDIVAVYGDSNYVGFSIGDVSCVRAAFASP